MLYSRVSCSGPDDPRRGCWVAFLLTVPARRSRSAMLPSGSWPISSPTEAARRGVSTRPVPKTSGRTRQASWAASWTIMSVTIEIGGVGADDEIEFVEHDGIVDNGPTSTIVGPRCSAKWFNLDRAVFIGHGPGTVTGGSMAVVGPQKAARRGVVTGRCQRPERTRQASWVAFETPPTFSTLDGTPQSPDLIGLWLRPGTGNNCFFQDLHSLAGCWTSHSHCR